MTDMPDLEPVPEDWERGLAIVAHPDDMEYGASAAVARWTGLGKQFAYLLVTRGEAGIDGMDPAEVAERRSAEQREACAAVGVDDLEFLNHPDGTIEYGLGLRRQLAAVIRRRRPEIIVTINHHDTWGHGALNMADHRVVGLAVIDAVRDAANRWVFRELLDDGLEPWPGVRWIAVNASPRPTHAVDISGTIDRGIASLAAHRVYLAGLGDSTMSDPGEFLRGAAAGTGERFGGRLATSFELFSM